MRGISQRMSEESQPKRRLYKSIYTATQAKLIMMISSPKTVVGSRGYREEVERAVGTDQGGGMGERASVLKIYCIFIWLVGDKYVYSCK